MNKDILIDHDGGLDDILSQLLVLTMPNVNLIGITVTPADCFIEPALESSYKLLQLMRRRDVPLGRGDYYGINAFPNEWRARPEIVNALPMLINLEESPDIYNYPNAVDLIHSKLIEASNKVTILLTGPCSNLVLAIDKNPELKDKIEQIVWMGGAVRVQGNVQTYQHNGTAEWNVFWDPISANKLIKMSLPLTLIPLDVTNKVPVTRDFLSRLAKQSNYILSNLVGQIWALTIDTIPSSHYTYFMWDILAASFLSISERFTVETVKINVSTRSPNAGQTCLDDAGYKVKIATDVDTDFFYEYLLEQFRK